MQTAERVASCNAATRSDESDRNQRIHDARIFRQRISHQAAEQTLRLEHQEVNQAWMRSVADAKASIDCRHFDRAEELLNASVRYSTNPQQLAYSCGFLAETYYQQKAYEKAEPLCLKVLSLYEQNEESTSRADFATALHNTAFLYQAMRHYDQAEVCYLEAVQIRTELLQPNNPVMVAVIDDYKSCIRARKEDANPWSRQSQRIISGMMAPPCFEPCSPMPQE